MPLRIEDYQAALLALLPRGPAWPRERDGALARTVLGLAGTALRLHQRAENLLRDAFPVAPLELLPEWEETLGLPDCGGPGQSTALRQAAVAARFAGRGGQSVAYLVGVAAAYGAAITVTAYKAAVVGDARVGDPIRDAAWAFHWTVTSEGAATTFARVGSARVGDRLADWGNEVLECALRRVAPAHTTVSFVYI